MAYTLEEMANEKLADRWIRSGYNRKFLVKILNEYGMKIYTDNGSHMFRHSLNLLTDKLTEVIEARLQAEARKKVLECRTTVPDDSWETVNYTRKEIEQRTFQQINLFRR